MKISPTPFFSFLTFLVLLATESFALPSGTEIVTGQASLARTGIELRITASDGAILNHAAFEVAAGETVRFLQPGVEARVLNRILSSSPSRINGNLLANGHVYLVNPAGVLFGDGAVVEVGKLHAIAGRLSDDDFLARLDRFRELSGEVRNEGSIHAGEVVLAGAAVSNLGRIHAPGGLVVLASGDSLELVASDGSVAVNYEGESPGVPAGAFFAVGDLAGHALLQSGVVEASRVEVRAGVFRQDAEASILADQSSGEGGSVRIEAARQAEISGTVDAAKATISATPLAQNSGSLKVSELYLDGGSKSSSPYSLSLNSSANQIGKIAFGNHFDSATVQNSGSMEIVKYETTVQGDEMSLDSFVNKLDLRVSSGDLTVSAPLAPSNPQLASSLLLAAEGNLVLNVAPEQLDYSIRLLYGTNLTKGDAFDANGSLDDFSTLSGASFALVDLNATPSVALVRTLAADNPTFEAFQVLDPKTGTNRSLAEMTDLQFEGLATLIGFGAFSQYSYFLEGTIPAASASGGASAAGGSAGASLDAGSSSSESGGSDSGSSDGGDSGGDGDSESSDGGDGGGDGDSGDGGDGDGEGDGEGESGGAAAKAAKAASAVPFAPISRPILSPAANRLLDKVLSPKVETRLEKYLNR